MIGLHPIHLYKFRYSELSEIYLAETLKQVAFSLVSIFVPIYLLQLHFSFRALCTMFLILNLVRLIIEPFVGYLISRFGPKHILAISYPISFAYLVLIAIGPQSFFDLAVIAITWAISDSLHWLGYHSNFSKVKKSKKTGREIGTVGMLGVIAAALGPVIGGVIGSNSGLHNLFFIAPALLLIAMLPLFKTAEKVKKSNLHYKGLFRRMKGDMIAHAGLSFDVSAGTTIWPLFIYIVVKEYFQLGAIVSTAFLVSLVSMYLFGRLTDIMNKKFLVFVGSLSLSGINILRYMSSTVKSVFSVNMLGTVLTPLAIIPLFSLFYLHAKDNMRIEYIVYLEMAGDIGRSIFWSILIALTYSLSMENVITTAFLIVPLGLVMSNLVRTRLSKA